MVLGTRRRLLAALVSVAAAVTLALAVTGRGCAETDSSPERVTRAFVTAARRGDGRVLWELLGPASRARLAALAESATQKAGGARRFAAVDMIDAVERPGTPSLEVSLASRTGGRAIVEVHSPDGSVDRLEVVEVDGHWRVELP